MRSALANSERRAFATASPGRGCDDYYCYYCRGELDEAATTTRLLLLLPVRALAHVIGSVLGRSVCIA